MEGRHGPPRQRLHQPPAGGRLAHHHRQSVGRAGAGEIQRQVRGRASLGDHQSRDVWQHHQRGLEQGRTREGQ